MPDVPVAELIFDSDWGAAPPKLVETDRGWSGVRHYKVNTEDIERAMSASGLPRRGERWSPALSSLRVVQRTPEYVGGQDVSGTGVGGWVGVRVEYETPGFSGRILPRDLGGAGDYTEMTWEPRTARVYYDARVEDDPVAYGVQIDNGRGVDKAFGVRVAIVHRFRPLDTPSPDGLVENAWAAPINSEELSLPPEEGSSVGRTVPKLGAQFAGFERRVAQVVDDSASAGGRGVEFVIRLELAPVFSAGADISGHDAFWNQEGANGAPVAFRTNQVDGRSDYRTLVNA